MDVTTMPENQLHPTLADFSASLDSLAKKIVDGSTDNRPLIDQHGWTHPAITRQGLSRFASDIADDIRHCGAESLDESILKVVNEAAASIEKCKNTTVSYFFNGHGAQAIPAYLAIMLRLQDDLKP